MMRKLILVVLVLHAIFMDSNSQSVQQPDSGIKTEKAKYLNGDLNKILSTKAKYPETEMMNGTQGDVAFSFQILSNGKLENLAVKNSSDNSLLNSAKMAMYLLDGEWSPAKLNDVPTDQKYLIAFRFRIYMGTSPYDYKGQGKKLVEKQKYEKALKNFNIGIEDNKYDCELYELRSKVKELLGDVDGAKKDQVYALNLKDEIMSIIDITVIGVRSIVKLGGTITATPSYR